MKRAIAALVVIAIVQSTLTVGMFRRIRDLERQIEEQAACITQNADSVSGVAWVVGQIHEVEVDRMENRR